MLRLTGVATVLLAVVIGSWILFGPYAIKPEDIPEKDFFRFPSVAGSSYVSVVPCGVTAPTSTGSGAPGEPIWRAVCPLDSSEHSHPQAGIRKKIRGGRPYAWFGSVTQFGQWWGARNRVQVDVERDGSASVVKLEIPPASVRPHTRGA